MFCDVSRRKNRKGKVKSMITEKVKRKRKQAKFRPVHQIGCEIEKTPMEARDRYRAHTGSRLVSGEYIPTYTECVEVTRLTGS